MRLFPLENSSRLPVTTYRLGFSREFRLSTATRLLPYLDRLGVTTLYASPLFVARQGSTHGYDLTDPTRLNPEIGTMAEMDRLSRGLADRGMGMILDIVPNHMAAHYENPWWRDLLENGESSPVSMFFDVDWTPPQRALRHRISLPILGEPYRKVLENQELLLVFVKNGFAVRYWDTLLPVDPATLSPVLRDLIERIPPSDTDTRETLEALQRQIESLPPRQPDPLSRRLRNRFRKGSQRHLRRLSRDNPSFSRALQQVLVDYQGIRGIPSTFDRLDALLSRQVYWLSHWKTVTRTLNYRRFFDVADLVGVRMEDERVFEAFHRLVRQGLHEGFLDGVRVDHVDGLRDPADYLHRLSRIFHEVRPDRPPLIWVEKILGAGETLPDWPVVGTTGYEFIGRVTDLLTDPEGARTIRSWYEETLAPHDSFSEIAYQKKKEVAETLMGGELRRLTSLLEWIAMEERDVRETGFRELQAGLVEVTACLSVYRTYIRPPSVPEESKRRLKMALEEARKRHPNRRQGLFRFFERVLTLDFPPGADEIKKERWIDFVLRWQQFSGAVMAKGVEDTAFYLHVPLLSSNEVGSSPETPFETSDSFHRFNQNRLERSSLSLSATSTHDTKRSGDLRARIMALSGHAKDWIDHVERWRHLNRSLRKARKRAADLPHPAFDLFIYQTLAGAWPLDPSDMETFVDRLLAYFIKAAREAKRDTDWISPDSGYEESLCRYVRALLRPGRNSPFLSDFLDYQTFIAQEGAALSLIQLVLKATAPGVFDLYRGDELWDLSLVDPDNRRPVDYLKRGQLLNSVIEEWTGHPDRTYSRLLTHWRDGRIKLLMTWLLLGLRKEDPELLLAGEYRPLPEEWEQSTGWTGFLRRRPEREILVVFTRRVAGILEPPGLALKNGVLPKGGIPIPEDAAGPFRHLFTGRLLVPERTDQGLIIPLDEALGKSPVTVLIRNGAHPAPR